MQMKQSTFRVWASVKAKKQQHHVGKILRTSLFGKMVDGKILAVHPFGVVDIELPNGSCYRVSGISLETK